jgi:hypothetical protein
VKYVLQEPQSTEQEGGPIPDDSFLEVEILGIREAFRENKDKTEKYEKLRWRFQVADPESDFDGRVLFGETSRSFVCHRDCKLYAWTQQIMGYELPTGFELETDDLIGRRCIVHVGAEERKDGGGIWNTVKDVRPSALTVFEDAPF